MTTMPWGKHRGRRLDDIPLSYLAWLLDEATLDDAMLRAAIRSEVRERLAIAPELRYVTVPARVPAELGAAVRAIVRVGYLHAAQRVHPDHGGSTLAMQTLTEAREWLTNHVLAESR